jgi:Flp pilus assembly protein TadG
VTRHRDDGAVTVEFAVVGMVALVLLFGLVLLGVHAAYSGLAEHGARKAARAAAVRSIATGRYPTDDEVSEAARISNGVLGTPVAVLVERRAGSGSTSVPCTVDGAGGSRRCGEGDVVTVTLTYETPGLSAVGSAVPGFVGTALETITRQASARFE